MSRPKIIFLVTNNRRADLVGCAGNRIIHTPNLELRKRPQDAGGCDPDPHPLLPPPVFDREGWVDRQRNTP